MNTEDVAKAAAGVASRSILTNEVPCPTLEGDRLEPAVSRVVLKDLSVSDAGRIHVGQVTESRAVQRECAVGHNVHAVARSGCCGQCDACAVSSREVCAVHQLHTI